MVWEWWVDGKIVSAGWFSPPLVGIVAFVDGRPLFVLFRAYGAYDGRGREGESVRAFVGLVDNLLEVLDCFLLLQFVVQVDACVSKAVCSSVQRNMWADVNSCSFGSTAVCDHACGAWWTSRGS